MYIMLIIWRSKKEEKQINVECVSMNHLMLSHKYQQQCLNTKTIFGNEQISFAERISLFFMTLLSVIETNFSNFLGI